MLHLLDQRKQSKMQWCKDTNQSSADNANNVRRETSGQFRNKKKEYPKWPPTVFCLGEGTISFSY
jgi:hypothetical protein